MKKPFLPQMLADIACVAEISVSPDGKYTAFTRYMADLDKNGFVPHVYILDNADGTEKPLCGEAASHPSYTDSGVYFMSDQSGSAQVFLWNGESARQMTHMRHGVKDFAAAQNGRLAVETVLYQGEENGFDAEMSAQEAAAWKEKQEYEPYVIDDFIYKLDSAFGMKDGGVSRIALVGEGGAQLIGEDGIDAFSPAWDADGRRIAYYAKPYRGTKAEAAELYVWDGEKTAAMTHGDGVFADGCPCFIGENAVCTAIREFEDGSFSEWLLMAQDGVIKPLFSENAQEICHGVNCAPIGRSVYGDEPARYAYEDGWLYFLSCWRGDDRLFKMRPDGNGTVLPVETGNISVHGFAVRADGSLILLGGDERTPAELYRYDGALTRLTKSNAWLDGCELPPIHRLKLPYGGDIWVMEPAGREEGRLYPAVLDIHGGPECCYADDFWHEFYALSGAGMAVIWANPRGGMGYGREAVKPGGWGSEAWDDLMCAVDAAVGLGFIDGERVGVTGGSYGGYMTVKLISRSRRFRAAVAQRLLCNTATSYGTGDMGFASASKAPDEVDMYGYLMDRAGHSLITRVDDIETPLLILHGYKDLRCGFEQAEQLFVALHERKPELPVRLVMFPNENHGLTRAGRPAAQIRHLSEMCGWFGKYLSGEEKTNG